MITITKDDDHNISIMPEYTIDVFLARRAVEDIADKIEDKAKELAPLGETGALKAHPVEVHHHTILSAFERIDTRSFSIGGGFSIRGGNPLNRGQFSRGGVSAIPAEDVEQIDITLPEEPRHAKWVHNGTGIYGTFKTPIVPTHKKLLVFEYHGIKYKRKSVAGQAPQPYLSDAYVIINREYVPVRIAQLRAEIRTT